MRNGVLYFQVDVPEDMSRLEGRKMMEEVANIVAETDITNDAFILPSNVTPKFLPLDEEMEVNEIPVVPYEVEEDELKELVRDD